MFKKILLATHGTPGARKAEALAADWAKRTGAELLVLSVANEAWKDMTCDDWLNTSTTRNTFGGYVEGQISAEVDRLHTRIREDMQDISPKFACVVGKPFEAIAEVAAETEADVLIIGARQKKQAPGFKDRVTAKDLHPLLPCPLVVAP
ncbi:universal stress protein [Desulfovibrio oxyclinae]|jgi:nucleotide-binding universal stress UspA family protein|uniref:universal stress protein n=1 Tax=Desulfovibrio oxyclinae TaxID=63560 RepID=UPI00035E0C31|nr:universal stress protein [Desulfovibrio oxyclinae]